MPDVISSAPVVGTTFSSETLGALRAMNRAFADVVLENHRFGLPVIQYIDGQVVETPTDKLLPLAYLYLETNGSPQSEQVSDT